MRARTPTIHCDADDGACGAWDVDYYDSLVSAVDGVAVTRVARAPGWTSTAGGDDFCPDHKPEVTS